jgi:hypothetical protein
MAFLTRELGWATAHPYSPQHDEVVHESCGLRYPLANGLDDPSCCHLKAIRDCPMLLLKRIVISRDPELLLRALSTHSLNVETAAQLDLLLGGDNRRIAVGVSGQSVCPPGNALATKNQVFWAVDRNNLKNQHQSCAVINRPNVAIASCCRAESG